MSITNLFPEDHVIGVFRGFSDAGTGLEFHADILINYRDEYQDSPMHGQFILVQLASTQEAVVGRITNLRPEGRLSKAEGEEYALRASQGKRQVPEDLRKSYLRYRVNLRVLGVIRIDGGKLRYAPSHRRLPHVGSHVAFPSPEVLRYLAKHDAPGEPIGYLCLGEYLFADGVKNLRPEPWMQVKAPAVLPCFDIQNLVARRTFIFARAGFGKSNLNKLLFEKLYSNQPQITTRNGKRVDVGTLIFDPDGEYYWPDANGNPGLCDVPGLEEHLVLFTEKDHESEFYRSFKADRIRLDIRRLKPKDIIEIALPASQQSFQNVRKLKGLTQQRWSELVNIIDELGNGAPIDEVARILGLVDQSSDAEAVAARSNLTYIVKMLHSRESRLMDKLMESLRDGKLCIIDISMLRGKAGLTLAGIILQRIFEHNQREFTKARPDMIPVVAVIEEAQTVLSSASMNEEGPFVAWVKEGRKYNLGAVLVTQQPGSITHEILSQGDNWFLFHLLSNSDLESVRKANAHFSRDLLSSLLNEPIPGNGVFWSSTKSGSGDDARPYPIPVRILEFGKDLPGLRDPDATGKPAKTHAIRLNAKYAKERRELLAEAPADPGATDKKSAEFEAELDSSEDPEETPEDAYELIATRAIRSVKNDPDFQSKVSGGGIPWYGIMVKLQEHLPESLEDRRDFSYNLVPQLLDEAFGHGKWGTEKRQKSSGPGETTWVVLKGD